MTMFEQPVLPEEKKENPPAVPAKRPPAWSLSNWPVAWKVLAIVIIPIAIAAALGGLRIHQGLTDTRDLRSAAQRAAMVGRIANYTEALERALWAYSSAGDGPAARKAFDDSSLELERKLSATAVDPDVRSGITAMLSSGPPLLDRVASNSIGPIDTVNTYAPILLTAEDAIVGSVQVGDEEIRTQAQALSRAVGARGQMLMQKLLVTRGAEVSEPELRTELSTLAGMEPSALPGVSSGDATALQDQMAARMAIISDPAAVLVGNPDLLASLQATDDIATKVINDTTASVSAAVDKQASLARTAAIRDAAIVLTLILAALLVVLLGARSLVRPLRRLREAALRVAHQELPAEVQRIGAGEQPGSFEPIPVYTTEEIGQVAHAVDDLHEQALLMAAEQARLHTHVSDMFETMSWRNRSLVDRQLSLIDELERSEDDPQRLDALFKLDHLAAQMRRSGTNLLVLSGAKIHREQSDSVPVADVIKAAISQVEDYRRVIAATAPDSAVIGSGAGDIVHLLAELIDNGLRYSPPTSQVRVSAAHTDNRLVIEVSDTGLGMTEADLRMANKRMESEGEVDTYTARHMGLYVVGRLAHQHGVTVRLRNSVAGEPGEGMTAGVVIPAALIDRPGVPGWPALDNDAAAAAPLEDLVDVVPPAQSEPVAYVQPYRNGTPHDDGSSLPRRDPGASGFFGVPDEEHPEEPAARMRPPSSPAGDTDVIFQRMVSEWLIDPYQLMEPVQSWESVWDSGWEAAAHADEIPIDEHTEHGLPVRAPGARLVPGSMQSVRQPNGTAHEEPVVQRDPENVRASLSSHWSGVRAGRSHAREDQPESDQ